jgi:hypothetical protein
MSLKGTVVEIPYAGQHIDKDRLAKAIAQAKGTDDPRPWLAKKELLVDEKSGEKVEPDENGGYRKGAIPYPVFAIGYSEVTKIYDRLGAPDPVRGNCSPTQVTAAGRAKPLPALDLACRSPR